MLTQLVIDNVMNYIHKHGNQTWLICVGMVENAVSTLLFKGEYCFHTLHVLLSEQFPQHSLTNVQMHE